jgi:hypothetical protein
LGAEPRFQRCELLAHCRLADVQIPRRLRKAAAFNDTHEHAHCVELIHAVLFHTKFLAVAADHSNIE